MPKSILLVDDTETVLLLERAMLKGEGFNVRVARNGVKALEEVDKAPPNLILLDIVMPELDGIETCRRLKENPRTRSIPVIIVTTKGESKMVTKAFEVGCDGFLTKPLDMMELLAKVHVHIS